MTGRMNFEFVLFIYLVTITVVIAETWDKGFWYKNNDDALEMALKSKPNTNVAKNIVLAIGDGMGIGTTTATRVYRGQLTDGLLGEEALLTWDKFPHVGLSKTYCTDMTTTDSAASGTAYHCGVKTKYNVLGLDDRVIRNNCSSAAGTEVSSVLDFALAEGKSVGIVTTDSLVGGSPASAYAHSAQRDWKIDADLPDSAKGVCKDIARQLIEDNIDIHVLLGGGRASFLPQNETDPEYPDATGKRTDGINLVSKWREMQASKSRKAVFVANKDEFDKVSAKKTDYLLGLFEPKRMQEETVRRVNNTEPSLAEMTKMAIKILSKNPKGFYLFVEGAAIDKGHHQNRARKALEEGLAFDDAVSNVMAMTSPADTLVVVSADHSQSFVFGGVSQRGQSILSIVNNTVKTLKDKTGNHYTVLSYGTGPGYVPEAERVNLTAEYFDQDRVYQSVFPIKSASHSSEDVPIFASGPMSHLFTGVHEQTFIAHGMAYAACIGRNKHHCDERPSPSSGATLISSYLLMYLTTLYLAQ